MLPYKLIFKDLQCEHVTISSYPDSQPNVILDMNYFNNPKRPFEITCRTRSFNELGLLCAIVSALENADFIIDEIKFAYLFGARSDRKFEEGQAHYFRDVIAPIVNSLPGSHRALQLHGRAKSYLTDCRDMYYDQESIVSKNKTLIGGDESACDLVDDISYLKQSRYSLYFTKNRISQDVIKTSLSPQFINYIELLEDDTILVIDDLCDGGRTFIEAGKYLKEKFPDKKLELFVVHGLFTRGFNELYEHYDVIHTTNSYADWIKTDKLNVIKVI